MQSREYVHILQPLVINLAWKRICSEVGGNDFVLVFMSNGQYKWCI